MGVRGWIYYIDRKDDFYRIKNFLSKHPEYDFTFYIAGYALIHGQIKDHNGYDIWRGKENLAILINSNSRDVEYELDELGVIYVSALQTMERISLEEFIEGKHGSVRIKNATYLSEKKFIEEMNKRF